jgi:metal-responsive CopG/Arc/MetJ family transcriptional regulator
MKNVVPEGEGVGVPLSLRVPEKLLARLDACAEQTGNPRTETLLHLVRWALTQYENEQAQQPKPKKSA